MKRSDKDDIVYRVTELTLGPIYEPGSLMFRLFQAQLSKLNMDVLTTLRNRLTV